MPVRHAVLTTSQISDVIIVASGDAASGDAVTGIYFPGHWTKPDWASFGPRVDAASDPVIALAAAQLGEYLAGDRTTFDFPMAAHGTPFEEKVWAILRDIPFGERRTYGDIAEQLGDRNLARMVGQAVGHNPLSIVVGCHRVVGASGKLTGYAGGLERKEFLLALEAPVLDEARLAEAGLLF